MGVADIPKTTVILSALQATLCHSPVQANMEIWPVEGTPQQTMICAPPEPPGPGKMHLKFRCVFAVSATPFVLSCSACGMTEPGLSMVSTGASREWLIRQ